MSAGPKALDCADTGTTKLHRLTENNGAANIDLTAAGLQDIEAASAQIKVLGTRYTEAMERATGL